MQPVPDNALGITAILGVAVIAGIAVSNVYFNQALLPVIAQSFQVAPATVGWLATASQIGYAIGLFFVVPLGDRVNPLRLMRVLLLSVAVALMGASVAPALSVLVALTLLLCVGTCVPQILLPLAARLAPQRRQGMVIAVAQTGLVLGVVLCRPWAIWLAAWLHWRVVYGAAAMLMLIAAASLPYVLPQQRAQEGAAPGSYGALLASCWGYFRRVPALRLSCALGALVFAGFSAFWSILAFKLGQAPFNMAAARIGLVMLLAALSCGLTPLAGNWVDRLGCDWVSRLSISVVGGCFLAAFFVGDSLVGLILVANGITLATQFGQVANQARVFSHVQAQARSRANAVYMACNFLGGALGSAVGSYLWLLWGWPGVAGLGLSLALLAGVVVLAVKPGLQQSI